MIPIPYAQAGNCLVVTIQKDVSSLGLPCKMKGTFERYPIISHKTYPLKIALDSMIYQPFRNSYKTATPLLFRSK